ncbi:glycosyltransferase [Acidicapsa dinghuensis]|uniref:Glycosyltransferase n=1 Tax=Acidicapsa dinghuensis TaxID=2218256 RepID=A0ABW1ENC1_9BACT|nr:glycosyltransferase [Acidicapsa dinghuensis]
MRILYVLTSLGIGGAEKQVIDLAARMSEQGHKVSFLILKHSVEEWPVKGPVLRLNLAKTAASLLRGLRFARSFLALIRPDIVHSHTYPANLFARLLLIKRFKEFSRPGLVNTIHNVYEGGWHRMLLYRLTNRWVDRITAVSTAAAERFIHLHAVPAVKITVLTNGIDTDHFNPDRAQRRRVRNQMLVDKEFVWIAVGRIAPAKDYPNLLRAFHLLQQAKPETQLWIAGEGNPASLAIDSDLQNNPAIRWLGLRYDIAELLDAADGFVLSSAWEGLPIALAEAMAMAKTVVATDVGGVRELVGDAGFLVPPRNSEALKDTMQKAMSTPVERRRFLEAAARSRIRQSFSLQSKVSEWEKLYGQILEGRHA